jgi:ribonuclease R
VAAAGSLEQAILQVLAAAPQRSFKIKDLARELNVRSRDYKQLRETVLELARSGKLATLPRRHFQHPSAAQRLVGEVEGSGGRATRVRDALGRRLPLSPASLEHVAPGDRVQFRRVREEGGAAALVQRVEWAAAREVFGRLERHRANYYLIPDRRVPGIAGGIRVDASLLASAQRFDGEVLARAVVAAYEPGRQQPHIAQLELLGAADHPKAAMARRIAEAAWPSGFSDAALAEATAAAQAEDERARRDLTACLVFTIDPLTAKDHDDAVSIERLEGGAYRLGVHIADVASYVVEAKALDEEGMLRATSVYPPGSVLPMLPEVLSAGACSLHHGVERRSLSAQIEYAADGSRRGIAIGRSRIRSRASLAYEQAERWLADARYRPPAGHLAADVEPDELRSALLAMRELAELLRRRRAEAGSLFLERPEREFRFDADGHVADVQLRAQLESHWIIEEFMLEANRAVAESLHAARMPLLWRVHEEPDPRKLDELCDVLEHLGVRWAPRTPVTGHDYMELLHRVHDRPDRSLLHLLALRSLMKAEYRAGWDRHFGLAFAEYTHFTSPIRRYPDLHNQRWLHRLIDARGSDGWIEAGGKRLQGAATPIPAAERELAERLGRHCSEREREAALIERDCADICSADRLKPREGEEFEGIIVSLVSSGLFVELAGEGVDGFLGLDQLPRDWYTLDRDRHAFVAERSGQRLTLGQRVRVVLEFADVQHGRLWLGFVQAARPQRRRGAAREGR